MNCHNSDKTFLDFDESLWVLDDQFFGKVSIIQAYTEML